MSTRDRGFTEERPVEHPPGLDLDAYRKWYDERRPGEIAGPLRATVIAGGKSNLTYEVTDGVSRWIVRRPPLGHVQHTAHDMRREYTVMTALAGTGVPVPRTYALCSDPDVLGARFYVMQHVEGVAYRDAGQLRELGPRRTATLARRMVEVLARLHAVDPEQAGLADFGRPRRFLARQVDRWGVQLTGSKSRELPDAERLLRRLAGGIPDSDDGRASGLVHGDYRLDNLLMDAAADRPVRAVVDWEMATLGDPLTDVALMLVYDRMHTIAGGATIADYGAAPGYPGAREQLQAYAEAGGRDLAPLGFHLGLAHLKLAVILEGIHYRHLRGQTVGQGFDGVGEAVRPLLAAGLAALDGRFGEEPG